MSTSLRAKIVERIDKHLEVAEKLKHVSVDLISFSAANQDMKNELEQVLAELDKAITIFEANARADTQIAEEYKNATSPVESYYRGRVAAIRDLIQLLK